MSRLDLPVTVNSMLLNFMRHVELFSKNRKIQNVSTRRNLSLGDFH